MNSCFWRTRKKTIWVIPFIGLLKNQTICKLSGRDTNSSGLAQSLNVENFWILTSMLADLYQQFLDYCLQFFCTISEGVVRSLKKWDSSTNACNLFDFLIGPIKRITHSYIWKKIFSEPDMELNENASGKKALVGFWEMRNKWNEPIFTPLAMMYSGWVFVKVSKMHFSLCQQVLKIKTYSSHSVCTISCFPFPYPQVLALQYRSEPCVGKKEQSKPGSPPWSSQPFWLFVCPMECLSQEPQLYTFCPVSNYWVRPKAAK